MKLSEKRNSNFTPHPETENAIKAVLVDVTELKKRMTAYGEKEEFRLVFETEAHDDENDRREFDLEALIGHGVKLIIQHEHKDDKTYANISFMAPDKDKALKPSGKYICQRDREVDGADTDTEDVSKKASWESVNPHFPTLRSDPMALSEASRRKQIPSSRASLTPPTFPFFSVDSPRSRVMRHAFKLSLAAFALISTSVFAAQHLVPLTGFGTNGWLAPGAIPQLDTSNSQRGMAVSPTTGNLVLVDRDSTLGNNAYVLSGTTGAVNGTLTPPAGGYAGGTFVVNGAGVGSDGSVYVGSLATFKASSFKVYSWASDSNFTTPATVAFNLILSDPSWGGVTRVGDVMAATGSGPTSLWAASGTNSAAGTNSTFSVGSVNASNTQTTYTAIPGTPTASNGYRHGLSFIDSSSLVGTAGTTLYTTDFSGSPVTAQAGPIAAAQRPVAYLNHNGTPWVATIDTNGSNVSIYNLTDPLNPVLYATANNTTGTLTGNANGSGGIGWGPSLGGDSYSLYAMSTNQGIQGFVVTLSEPSTYAAWQSANGTAQAANLDHDSDGISNGVEHFLGGIANTTGNSNPLPGVTNTAGVLSVTWTRHPDFPGFPANYGTAVIVETSATLTDPWTPAVVGVGAGFVEITGNNVKYTFPAGTKDFARLKVVPTP